MNLWIVLKLLFYDGVLENYFILDTLILMGSLAHKKQKFNDNCKNLFIC